MDTFGPRVVSPPLEGVSPKTAGTPTPAPPLKKVRSSLWGHLKRNLGKGVEIGQHQMDSNRNLVKSPKEEKSPRKDIEKITLSEHVQDRLLQSYLKEDGLTEEKLRGFLSRTISLTVPFDFDVKPYFIIPEDAQRKTKLKEEVKPAPPPRTLLSQNSTLMRGLSNNVVNPPSKITGSDQVAGAVAGTMTLARTVSTLTRTTSTVTRACSTLTRKNLARIQSKKSFGGGKGAGGGGPLADVVLEEPEVVKTIVYSPVIQPEKLLLLVQHLMKRDKDLAAKDGSLTDTFDALRTTQPLRSTVAAAKGDAPTVSGVLGFKRGILGKLQSFAQREQNNEGSGAFESTAQGSTTNPTSPTSPSSPLGGRRAGDDMHVTKAKVMEALLPYYPPQAAKDLAQAVVAYGTREADIGSFVHSYRETMGATGGASGAGGAHNSSRLLKLFFKLGGRVTEDGMPPTLDADQLRLFCNSKHSLLGFSDSTIERLVRTLDQDCVGVIEFDEFELAVTQERLHHSLQQAAAVKEKKEKAAAAAAPENEFQEKETPAQQQQQSPLLHLLKKISPLLEHNSMHTKVSVMFPNLGKLEKSAVSDNGANSDAGGNDDGAGKRKHSLAMSLTSQDRDDWFLEDTSTMEYMLQQMKTMQAPEHYEQLTGQWDDEDTSRHPNRSPEELDASKATPGYMQPMPPHVLVQTRRIDVDPRFAASVSRNRNNSNEGSRRQPLTARTMQNDTLLEGRRGLPFNVLLAQGPTAQWEAEPEAVDWTADRPSTTSTSRRPEAPSWVLGPTSRLLIPDRQRAGLELCSRSLNDRIPDNAEVVSQCRDLIRTRFGEREPNWATQTQEDRKLLQKKIRQEKDASPRRKLEAGEKKVSTEVRSVYYAKPVRTSPRWDKKQEREFRERVLREKFQNLEPVPPIGYDTMLKQVLDVSPRREVPPFKSQQQAQTSRQSGRKRASKTEQKRNQEPSARQTPDTKESSQVGEGPSPIYIEEKPDEEKPDDSEQQEEVPPNDGSNHLPEEGEDAMTPRAEKEPVKDSGKVTE